jgi:hypothetical protein
MRNRRKNFWLWLALPLLLGALAGAPAAQGQGRIERFLDQQRLGDFTWGAYGASREYSKMGREEIVARENYCPTGGCVLRLESVEVKPSRARQGDRLTLGTTYTILTPEQVAIPVIVSREILFQGKSLGRTKSIDSRQYNGSWSQEVEFTIPRDAAPGDYTLRTRVSTGYDRQEKEVRFQVY